MNHFLRRALLATAATSLLATAACDSCKSNAPQDDSATAASAEPPAGIPIGMRLSPAHEQQAKQLQKRVNKARFSKALIKAKGNAQLFVYLAATSSDPKVIAASLYAMAAAYADRDAKRGRPRAGDDYGMVVAAHLQSAVADVQAGALKASLHAITGPKPYGPVVDELVAIAESHPNVGARITALGAFTKVRGFAKDPAIVATALHALEQDEPLVVSYALLVALRGATDKMARKDEFIKLAQALLQHKEPAVRARAVYLLARLQPGNDQAYQQLGTLLRDENPFARSVAAVALGKFGRPQAIHRLVLLADDMAPDQHAIAYAPLSGKRKSATFGKKGRTVHDVVVASIAALSKGTKAPFEPKPAGKQGQAASRTENAAAIKAWYAKAKAGLPPDSTPAPAPQGKPN